MVTISTINVGNLVNDGLGDDLRTAFQKVNSNFATLVEAVDITATNAQEAGAKVYKEQVDGTFYFRNLIAGNKISVTQFTDSIQIACTQPDAFTRIDANTGTLQASNNTAITIQGGNNVTTVASGQYLTIDTKINLQSIDFGTMSNVDVSTWQLIIAASNVDFGTVTNPGPFNIDLGAL